MSLHVELSEEAAALLRRQERKSRILSALIACLSILLIAAILALFALPMMTQDTPTIVTYSAPPQEEQDTMDRPVVQQIQRRPSAPAQNIAKVIAADTAAPTAIPVPDIEVSEPSMDFGDDLDFGQGWGDDTEIGESGGGFGSTSSASGGLKGYLYDLKQDPQGNRREYGESPRIFADSLLELQRADFSSRELAKHFVSPDPLYLTHLAIPLTSATKGPELFNVGELVEPFGWFAHYHGRVIAPKTGTFRFSGGSDDYLTVYVDGKKVLNASRRSISRTAQDWSRPEQPPGQHRDPFGESITYGNQFNLRAGQEIDLKIVIGERGGGSVGFILQIEEMAVDYEKTDSGRPILPLFTMAPILPDEIEELKKGFGSYKIEFDYDKTPLFRVKN